MRVFLQWVISELFRVSVSFSYSDDQCFCGSACNWGGLLILVSVEILHQILNQNGPPGSFRSLGAPGLDSLIPVPGQIPYQIFTQNVNSRVISEAGRSWVRFPHPGAWPDCPSNPYSERVSRLILEPGRSWARFSHSGAWPDSLSNP